MENCQYRNDFLRVTEVGLNTNPLVRPESPCDECQAMIEMGTKDTTCYNPELNERNCPLSPQFQDKT